MKTRLLLLALAGAMWLSGCVSTSGYGSSHSIGVGYSYGRPSAVYGYQSGYPNGYGYGSHGYGGNGYGSYGYRGDDYYYDYGHGSPYGYGSPYRYDNYNGHGYPYSVPRQRVIHPGNGSYGYPGYRGHGFNRPPGLPHPGSGRPPWGNIAPPPPGTHAPPPVQPPDTFTPDAGTRRDNVGLRRYKGGEMPESVITAED